MSLTEPKPGEYNKLKAKGNTTQLSGDFLDPGGVGFGAWRKFEVNKLIVENVLAGVDKFRAQVLDSGAEVQRGAGIVARIFGDKTPSRRKYRVYIPELAIDAWPFDYEIGSAEFNSAMGNAFEAYYEVPSRLWNHGPDVGAIVWVRFEIGPAGKHLLYPLITDIDSLGSQAGETYGRTRSASELHAAGTGIPAINADEAYQISDIIFKSIEQPKAAARAKQLHEMIGKQGVDESTIANKTIIVDNIHMLNHKAFSGGQEWGHRQYYIDNLQRKAWSSWFLNAPYAYAKGPGFLQHQKHATQNSADMGCCYPNALGALNRNAVLNDPEKYIGQILLMVFSKEEIQTNVSLKLVPGDASIVSQTAQAGTSNDPKTFEESRTEFVNVSGKTHMNIYVGPYIESDADFIGGNLGSSPWSTTSIKQDITGNSFLKLVEIVGINK